MRASIRQLPNGKYAVTWAARRNAATLEEAEQLAALEEPPPPRRRPEKNTRAVVSMLPTRPLDYDVSDELRALICGLHESGMSAHYIAALLAQANFPTARGGEWHPATVRKIVEAKQPRRAAQ
jgi:hypothetical protein